MWKHIWNYVEISDFYGKLYNINSVETSVFFLMAHDLELCGNIWIMCLCG